MLESFTAGAQRALDRAEVRSRLRGGSAVEAMDLLASLVDEEESRASEFLAEAGIDVTLSIRSPVNIVPRELPATQ